MNLLRNMFMFHHHAAIFRLRILQCPGARVVPGGAPGPRRTEDDFLSTDSTWPAAEGSIKPEVFRCFQYMFDDMFDSMSDDMFDDVFDIV